MALICTYFVGGGGGGGGGTTRLRAWARKDFSFILPIQGFQESRNLRYIQSQSIPEPGAKCNAQAGDSLRYLGVHGSNHLPNSIASGSTCLPCIRTRSRVGSHVTKLYAKSNAPPLYISIPTAVPLKNTLQARLMSEWNLVESNDRGE